MLNQKKIVLCALGTVAAATASGAGIVHFMLHRNGGGKLMRQMAMNKIAQGGDTDKEIQMKDTTPYQIQTRRRIEVFMEEVPEVEVETISEDGLHLKGYYYENKNYHRWLLGFHGYRARHRELLNCGFTTHFYDLGFQVLTPDLRASGNSEGNWIGMGWNERKDVHAWIDWILDRDPEAEIVLFGESMGAATVLATSGDPLPENVKAVIADAGYASVMDILHEITQDKMHMPDFPVVTIGSFFADKMAGLNLKDADMTEQVRKSNVPVLMFHGKEDSMVNFRSLQKLYDAKPGNDKRMVAVDHAEHVRSSYELQDEYWDIVREFISPYLKH